MRGSEPEDRPILGLPVELPGSVRRGTEGLAGVDVTDVRIHSDSARRSAFDARDSRSDGSPPPLRGEAVHAATENWHVVQQKKGR